MIKPKTKYQKGQDKKRLDKAAHTCAQVIKTFVRELWDSEFRIDWVYLGTINKMQDAHNEYEFAKKTQEEEYTFTSYDEDNKHEHWQNSTHIDRYK